MIPSVGIHRGISHAEYLAWQATSNSDLTAFWSANSPAHYRWAKDHQKEDSSPAKILGTACHVAILEPEKFDSLYHVGQKHDGRTKVGKAGKIAEAKASAGKIVLNSYDRQQIAACRESVMANPRARRIIDATPPEDRELSIVWVDAETGLLCKGRLDIPCLELGILADLKSTEDASPRHFAKSIHDFGYHRQGAHYLRGAASVGLDLDYFVLIAFEKDPPYASKCYRLDDDSLAMADDHRRLIMSRYAECIKSNTWPAYGDNLEDIALPHYARKDLELWSLT